MSQHLFNSHYSKFLSGVVGVVNPLDKHLGGYTLGKKLFLARFFSWIFVDGRELFANNDVSTNWSLRLNVLQIHACNEDLDSWKSILEARIEREGYDSILANLALQSIETKD